MSDKAHDGVGSKLSRRSIAKSMFALGVASICPAVVHSTATSPIPAPLNPRWYGFNLLEYFSTDPDWTKYFPYRMGDRFREDDFRWMRDWGFNWVRLPMDYRFWTDPNDPTRIREEQIAPIDRAIALGEQYGIHVNICLHRAPGECVLDMLEEMRTSIHITPEKRSIYSDEDAVNAFVYQWVYFARRYKGISNQRLSFNLVNEPIDREHGRNAPGGKEKYVQVAKAAVRGIRENDSERLIITDGYPGADEPIPAMFDTGLMQSCHDYFPIELTHYHTEWVQRPGSDNWPIPTWPLKDAKGKIVADKDTILKRYRSWGELSRHHIPIHFGEMGCNKNTPPNVVYSWFDNTLDMIGDNLNSGWALWNFRGPFGILDTERPGTNFKDWRGHLLDFTLLRLLQSKIKT